MYKIAGFLIKMARITIVLVLLMASANIVLYFSEGIEEYWPWSIVSAIMLFSLSLLGITSLLLMVDRIFRVARSLMIRRP